MREGRVQQVATPKALYERPVNRFVADFVGTNNFIPGVVKERADGVAVVETALGHSARVPARPGPARPACSPCAQRTSRWTAAGENVVAGRVRLASYLGNTLRYDVETAAGLVLKVDVGDPWQHEVLPAGHAVRVAFPASATLVLSHD